MNPAILWRPPTSNQVKTVEISALTPSALPVRKTERAPVALLTHFRSKSVAEKG